LALVDEIAEQLARDAFEQARTTDDARLIDDLSHLLGTTSPSLQEAFDAAIRYLRAEARAREFLQARLRVE
jgi:hypothetical protein